MLEDVLREVQKNRYGLRVVFGGLRLQAQVSGMGLHSKVGFAASSGFRAYFLEFGT